MNQPGLQLREEDRGGRGGTVLIFDDGSSFDYLNEIEVPKLTFELCRTFPDLVHYMDRVAAGVACEPDLLAIDVFCDTHRDFSTFEREEPLDQNQCGFQLYNLILRLFGHRFDTSPVHFFTSYPEAVRDIAAERLAKATGVRITSSGRAEFLTRLFGICVEEGLLTTDEIPITEALTQAEYARLFGVLAEEFEFSEAERCTFFGMTLSDTSKIDMLLDMTTLGNERIDVLLNISILLDTFVKEGDKRSFLTRCEPIDSVRQADLLLSGRVQDLLRVQRDLEFRVGGEAL